MVIFNLVDIRQWPNQQVWN